MTVNEGMLDRVVRVAAGAGLVLFALGVIFPGTGWNWVGWVGLVPIATGLLGNCPAYTILGISTCPMPKRAGGG